MMYLIYYRRDMRNSYLVTAASIEPSDYDHVVSVETTDLERLFRIMNCVDGGPTEIVGVGYYGEFGNQSKAHIRSLSVGDVAIEMSDYPPFARRATRHSARQPDPAAGVVGLTRGYLCECSGWKSFTDTEKFIDLQRERPVFLDRF